MGCISFWNSLSEETRSYTSVCALKTSGYIQLHSIFFVFKSLSVSALRWPVFSWHLPLSVSFIFCMKIVYVVLCTNKCNTKYVQDNMHRQLQSTGSCKQLLTFDPDGRHSLSVLSAGRITQSLLLQTIILYSNKQQLSLSCKLYKIKPSAWWTVLDCKLFHLTVFFYY